MNWQTFAEIWIIGVSLVVLQGVASYIDGFFSKKQLQARGLTNGWSFLEHGGMWADVFVISPLVAFIMSKFSLGYFTWYGIGLLGIAIGVSLRMGLSYRKNGIKIPEAHTHHGKTTVAGWIHGLYALMAIWVVALVMLTPTYPGPTTIDLVIIASILTPFFFLGVAKFNRRWKFDYETREQVIALTALVWLCVIIRTYF